MSARRFLVFGTLCLAALSASQAAPFRNSSGNYFIYWATAKTLYCNYAADCNPKMTDTAAKFRVPGNQGDAELITRTITGAPGTPGAGLTLYLYRLDVSSLAKTSGANCITEINFDFGTVERAPFNESKTLADVIVVQKGDVGKYAPSTNQYAGRHVWFPIPTKAGLCPGESTHFFGMANTSAEAVAGKAELRFKKGDPIEVDIRVPKG